jgi:hypothetical protein
MQVVYERCCGLDVHKKTVVACLITPSGPGERHKEIRSFRTTTQELLRLADWLTEAGCSHVAMEATGVYTPPPMLPIGGGPVKRGRRREWTDAKNHADLLLIDLHPFD